MCMNIGVMRKLLLCHLRRMYRGNETAMRLEPSPFISSIHSYMIVV